MKTLARIATAAGLLPGLLITASACAQSSDPLPFTPPASAAPSPFAGPGPAPSATPATPRATAPAPDPEPAPSSPTESINPFLTGGFSSTPPTLSPESTALPEAGLDSQIRQRILEREMMRGHLRRVELTRRRARGVSLLRPGTLEQRGYGTQPQWRYGPNGVLYRWGGPPVGGFLAESHRKSRAVVD